MMDPNESQLGRWKSVPNAPPPRLSGKKAVMLRPRGTFRAGLCLASAALCLFATIHARASETLLRDGWALQSACKLQDEGAAISSSAFHPQGWTPVAVPSTVLAAQVAAGKYKQPYYAMNLRKIPGATYPIGEIFSNLPMPADSPYRCGWWYRKPSPSPPPSRQDAFAALWRNQLPRKSLDQRPQGRRRLADCGCLSHLRPRRDGRPDTRQRKRPRCRNLRANRERSRHQLGRLESLLRLTRTWACGVRQPGHHRPSLAALADGRHASARRQPQSKPNSPSTPN